MPSAPHESLLLGLLLGSTTRTLTGGLFPQHWPLDPLFPLVSHTCFSLNQLDPSFSLTFVPPLPHPIQVSCSPHVFFFPCFLSGVPDPGSDPFPPVPWGGCHHQPVRMRLSWAKGLKKETQGTLFFQGMLEMRRKERDRTVLGEGCCVATQDIRVQLMSTWTSWSSGNDLWSLHHGRDLQGGMGQEKTRVLDTCYPTHSLPNTTHLPVAALLPWRTAVCLSASFGALNPGIDAAFVSSLEANRRDCCCTWGIHHCVQTMFI